MAVTSLRYDPGNTIEESKSGNYIYDGSASRFHEWSFRAGMRVRCSKEEDLKKTMSMIVEALRGEAAQVAMDLGLDELYGSRWIPEAGVRDQEDGLPTGARRGEGPLSRRP